MKRYTPSILLAALLMVIGYSTLLAQAPLKVKVNKMAVQGSSSLHDWESQITKADWKGTIEADAHSLTEIKNLEVKIPVESIKSTKGKMMDNKTYDAFNSSKFPYITYALTSAVIQANGTVEAKGNLSMAGVTKPMNLKVQYKLLPNGEVNFVLSKTFKMTEFKMDPPTAMMGTVKVGDEVTVNFDVIVNTKMIQ